MARLFVMKKVEGLAQAELGRTTRHYQENPAHLGGAPDATIPSMAEEGAAQNKKKTLTPEDFITSWPLYTPFDAFAFSPPNPISFHCNGKCGKETTWVQLASSKSLERCEFLHYMCSLCRSEYLSVLYRVSKTVKKSVMGHSGTGEMHVASQVQKIGQFPALSIDIPKALEKNLGDLSASLYKKALISRNQGFGLAAVTYIRRVVEDKTEELIEVVARLAESHNIDAEVVKKIRAAASERTTYDNKLKIAATVVPDSLVIDGVNPLGVLYSLVSGGLHDLTEEQCVAIADETKSVFEFTFTHLRAETKVREDFVAKVKKLAGGRPPAEKSERA
jgi:hypothetical protein